MERAFEVYAKIDAELRESLAPEAHADVERQILRYAVSNPQFSLSVAVQVARQYIVEAGPAEEIPLIQSSQAWLARGFVPHAGAPPIRVVERGADVTLWAAEHVRPVGPESRGLAAEEVGPQTEFFFRHADPEEGAPDYLHLGDGLSDYGRELLAQLWRIGVYVDFSDELPDNVVSEVQTRGYGGTAALGAPSPADREAQSRYRILLPPDTEDVMPTVLHALAKVVAAHLPIRGASGEEVPPLQPWRIESSLIVHLVSCRLGLPDHEDHWVEDYLYGPAVPVTGSVRWSVIFIIAECMEAVLRGEEATWEFHDYITVAGEDPSEDPGPSRELLTGSEVADVGNYVGAALSLYVDEGARRAAERLTAEAVAGNPQWAPHDAALLGVQVAELTGREAALDSLTGSEVGELARGVWASELEWAVRGYRVVSGAPGVVLGDGTSMFRDRDVVAVDPGDADWGGLVAVSAERLQWSRRLVLSEENAGRYQGWEAYGVSAQGIGYLRNLWRIGMVVLPPALDPEGNAFSVSLGADARPDAPPRPRMAPGENWYLVQLSVQDYAETFSSVTVAVASLFLGQYPKVWLGESTHDVAEASGDTGAAGLRELRVAAALVCQRLDMSPQWTGGPWWNRLGMGEEALPKEFDWARTLEAVDKSEDVFRGISPQLPAQW
jgi:hypothetical protein